MTISKELMAAVLSMDSYNRGYGAKIVVPGVGATIGNWSVSTDSETVLATKGIGKANSFYAVAYQYNGETIISYRGTDDKAADAGAYPTNAGEHQKSRSRHRQHGQRQDRPLRGLPVRARAKNG